VRDANIITVGTIFRDEFSYSSHPHVAVTKNGTILVVFNQTRRRAYILHPPHDPEYRNVIVRSTDSGNSWSSPEVVPGYQFHGTECASLTVLRNGTVLLNQWFFRWYPLGRARSEPSPEPHLYYPDDFLRELIESGELPTGGKIAYAPEKFVPWARGHGESWVHLSNDDSHSFTESTQVGTNPFHGGYGMRGAVELNDGALLLTLNDIPEYQTIFTVKSYDGGKQWREPTLVARKPGHLFTEAAMVQLKNGDLITAMRDDTTRLLHTCRSSDGGKTWSAPQSTGIDGYPPHLLILSDGRLLCTMGRRQPDFSIRAVVSGDGGNTWDLDEVICIRGNLSNKDLGYPATVELHDHSLLTVYYCQDERGITGVEFARWRI